MARRRSGLAVCNASCTAERKAVTATPASTNTPGPDPADWLTIHASPTPSSAPRKAPAGIGSTGSASGATRTIMSVAPKPAPAAAPSRYGSARGLRKTP